MVSRWWHRVLTAALCISFAEASTRNENIYAGPDRVFLFPVEGTVIFGLVTLVASLLEFAIDYLMAIENDYFQLVYASVAEETIVCSILTMLMIFAKSFGALQARWVLMLNYAVLSLFFMTVFFVFIIGCCVLALHVEMKKWIAFEATRIDADPRLSYKETIFRNCRDRFRESIIAADIKYNSKVRFSDYMRKMQRFTVAELTDLSWKAWLALAMMVVINGVRSMITIGSRSNTESLTRTDRTINVSSYIAFVGYGSLIVFIILHFLLQARLNAFASKPVAVVPEDGGAIEVADSANLLYFGKFTTTAHIFQCTILFLEWYFAVFVLGMAYEIWKEYSYVSIAIYAGALLPLVIFVLIFPWTMTMITMLNSLGTSLKKDEAGAIVKATEAEEQRSNAIVLADGNEKKQAGAHDEWDVDDVTLADKSLASKLGDAPAVAVRADHPNAPVRKGFTEKKTRPVFTDLNEWRGSNVSGNYDLPPERPIDPDARVFSPEHFDIGPIRRNNNSNNKRSTGWIESKVSRGNESLNASNSFRASGDYSSPPPPRRVDSFSPSRIDTSVALPSVPPPAARRHQSAMDLDDVL